MKTYLLLLFGIYFSTFNLLAQDQFEYQSSGLSDFVITSVEGKPAAQLFSETK
ncbi:MAG: hypothetical protein ABR595_03210 [Psychroflexus sp.]